MCGDRYSIKIFLKLEVLLSFSVRLSTDVAVQRKHMKGEQHLHMEASRLIKNEQIMRLAGILGRPFS